MSQVVSCDSPHIMEMTAEPRRCTGASTITRPGSSGTPSTTTTARRAFTRCSARPSTPSDASTATGIQPDARLVGGRRSHGVVRGRCGAAHEAAERRRSGLVVHRARPRAPRRTGCSPSVRARAPTRPTFTIPCSQAHEWEVAGHVDLTGKTASPPAPSDDRRVESAGRRPVVSEWSRPYLGHDPVNDAGVRLAADPARELGRRTATRSSARSPATRRARSCR